MTSLVLNKQALVFLCNFGISQKLHHDWSDFISEQRGPIEQPDENLNMALCMFR